MRMLTTLACLILLTVVLSPPSISEQESQTDSSNQTTGNDSPEYIRTQDIGPGPDKTATMDCGIFATSEKSGIEISGRCLAALVTASKQADKQFDHKYTVAETPDRFKIWVGTWDQARGLPGFGGTYCEISKKTGAVLRIGGWK
jgi:hypothetical protein